MSGDLNARAKAGRVHQEDSCEWEMLRANRYGAKGTLNVELEQDEVGAAGKQGESSMNQVRDMVVLHAILQSRSWINAGAREIIHSTSLELASGGDLLHREARSERQPRG